VTRSPEAWRRIVRACGGGGMLALIAGYAALDQVSREYRPAALLAFYGGFGLVLAAIVLWYRHVPPRPPAPEEPGEGADAEAADS